MKIGQTVQLDSQECENMVSEWEICLCLKKKSKKRYELSIRKSGSLHYMDLYEPVLFSDPNDPALLKFLRNYWDNGVLSKVKDVAFSDST